MTTKVSIERYDCFISYSWKDRKYVDVVVEDLKSIGLNIWIDRDRIKPGERIREAINSQIELSFCILVFISARSIESSFVLNEIDIAMLREMNEKKIVLIPIILGRFDITSLPSDLKGKLAIDLRNSFLSKYKRERSRLIHAIQESNPGKFHENFLYKEFIVDKEIFSHFAEAVNSNRRINQSTLNAVAEIIAETIITEKDQIFLDENVEQLDKIHSFFGKKGVRDMIAFCIVYRDLLYTGEVSEKDFEKIVEFFQVFLPVFGINQKILKVFQGQDVPLAIVLGINPKGDLAYRITGIEGYQNILPSISEIQ